MFGKKELKVYSYTAEELAKFKIAKISTDRGDIYIELFADEAPNTVANFATLANDGYYNNLNFHRVIPGFMAQGGCPTGTGTGGPGYAIACETANNVHKHEKGTISMAHAGPNTGGSQFFICFVPCPHLDGVHTVFGAIDPADSDSMAILDNIQSEDKILKVEILETR